MLAGAIGQWCPIVHQSAGGSQHLAGRADVNVALLIVGEGFPRERPVDSGRLVEDRNVASIARSLTNHPSISADAPHQPAPKFRPRIQGDDVKDERIFVSSS